MKCTKMLGWLVMAAALSFTACSSEDNLTQELTTQQPTETATNIHVSVGAGIDNAATRSTVDYNSSTKTRTLKFTVGDKLYIYRNILGDGTLLLTGELTMKDGTLADDGLSATFEGDLRICNQLGQETTYDFGNGDPLTGSTAYLLHKDLAAGLYTILSNGSVMLNMGGMAADDVVTLMTTALVVTGQYNGSAYQLSTTDTPAPILNCTIAGLTASQTYGFKLYKDGKNAVYVEHDTDASGTATFAFASLVSGTGHWTLEVKQSGAVVSSIDLGNRELTSKVYNISRYWYGGAMHRLVDLGNVNTSTHSDGLTLQDGDAVTGLLDGNNTSKRLKISIANGASVILKGVDIQGYNNNSFEWAGLTCAGDATIILADGTTNVVKGFYENYPGIFIAEGKTLTIQGSGSLTATSGGAANCYGAGIGGAKNIACGNIVIEGGAVTATGGSRCAGIGSGANASCGDISINGTANVTAKGGGEGAGIGSGYKASCGNITISGTANVTAKGGGEGAGIGSGYIASCGNITISGTAHVTATGGSDGAGIGTGLATGSISTCGNITISGTANVTATGGTNGAGIGSGYYGTVSGTISIEGGTVEATAGSAYSSGIGSGKEGKCGAIVIASGITQVIAKKTGMSCDIIGKGYEGTCGTLTIDGVVGATTSSTFPHLTSVLTNSNKTWTLTPTNPNP